MSRLNPIDVPHSPVPSASESRTRMRLHPPAPTPVDIRSDARPDQRLEAAREIIRSQSDAVLALRSRLDESFNDAVDLILGTSGHVIVVGMGKSGLIGQKIAATLASTGTPSFAVHPGEAYHGDLGMIRSCDLVLMLSYSGETEEVVRLIPHLKARGVTIVAMVGKSNSSLSRAADVTLDVSVDAEVCPHNLAPTNSTLAALAMGDTIAVTLMRERNFGPNDFARFHPGGSLGRQLLTRVRDAMHAQDLPIVEQDTAVRDVLYEMSRGRLGLAIITNNGHLAGIVTDGDLRRQMLAEGDILDKAVSAIMTRDPVCVHADAKLHDARAEMRKRRISALIVLDDRGEITGVLDTYGE